MLTAYTYYEPEEQSRIQASMKRSELFGREVEIAREYTKKHLDNKVYVEVCPICMKKCAKIFFDKWGITYYRCEECYSIVAGVSEEDAEGYESLPKLREFYASEEYQSEGERVRETRWEEIIDWISFRSFRYNGVNERLRIIDYGNRWNAFVDKIRESNLCGEYIGLYQDGDTSVRDNSADVVMAFDYIQRKMNPRDFFQSTYGILKSKGLLFLGIKAGSGMDVLLLKDKNPNVFPYEHVLMPSREGIYNMLEDIGYEVLEYTTPGMFDVNFVTEHVDDIPDEDYFIKYLLQSGTPQTIAELQRFIQKAGMSSYAQVVARKK